MDPAADARAEVRALRRLPIAAASWDAPLRPAWVQGGALRRPTTISPLIVPSCVAACSARRLEPSPETNTASFDGSLAVISGGMAAAEAQPRCEALLAKLEAVLLALSVVLH